MTNYEKLRTLRNDMLFDGKPPLEFGCEVVATKYGKSQKGIFIADGSYHIDGGFVCIDIKEQDNVFTEILGKPVTLQDIMLMLHKKTVVLDDGKKWLQTRIKDSGIDDNKLWIQSLAGHKPVELDLTKDPDKWDDETLGKLLSILK